MPVLDAQTAISYLVIAGGSIDLAAQRVTKDFSPNEPINEARLLATIAQDPSSIISMAQQIKVLTMAYALHSFQLTQRLYIEKMGLLAPKDTAKAYTDMLNSLGSMSSNVPTRPIDNFNALMQSLPPEIAVHVKALITPEGSEGPTTGPDSAPTPTPSPLNGQALHTEPAAGKAYP